MQKKNNQSLRERIIKYGVDNNYSSKTIDKVLAQKGLAPYNPLTSKYNWQRALERLPENAKEFGKDALTFGGMMVKPAMDVVDAFSSAPLNKKKQAVVDVINSYKKDPNVQNAIKGALIGGGIGRFIGPVGTVPGALVGGIVGGMGKDNFINAQLSPYNLSINKINNKEADWRDVVTGAQSNPVYAGVDLLSAGGGKLIGGVSKNVADAIPRSAPEIVRQLLPNKEVRQINRSLSTELGNTKTNIGKDYNAYSILEGTTNIDRAEIARHIMTGTSKLKGKQLTLADSLRDSLVKNSKLGVDLGLLDKNLNKADILAQYVMQYIPRSYNLIHADYRDIILGNKLRPTAKKIIEENNLSDTIKQLIKNGEELYNKDSISYLTQKLYPSRDPLNEVIARERNAGKNNYFDVTREIGRTTPEELGKVLDDSIRFQLDQISKAREFEGILNYILNNERIVGRINEADIQQVKNKALKEISKDIAKGDMPNLNNALSKSGLKSLVIDPVYYKSINNLFKKPLNAGMRRLLSQFKKNVLATPHWIFLNRAGNWANNIIEGVKLEDYRDAEKYSKIVPDQLKQQTSFSSYLNEGIEVSGDTERSIERGVGSAMKVPYNKIKNAIEKYKISNKSFEDNLDLASSLYSNVNDLIANPIFRTEAGLELTDRYANLIRQAKRMATGKEKWQDIVKRSNTDNKLFHKLNTEVNKSLGDYVGRNYALPSSFYDVLSELVPFYRFYNQTLRTTAHQLANNPYRFQGAVAIPNKIGRKEREDIQRRFSLDPEWYQGGVPYGYAGNNLRTMGLEQQPIQSVIGLLGGIGAEGDILPLVNPVISSIAPALMFKDSFGNMASTPRLYEMKRRGEDTKNFNPTLEEKLRYLGNMGLASTSSLYNMYQRISPELVAPFSGGLRTRYATHPFTPIPDSYNRKLPSETIMKQFGVKTSSNYKKKTTKSKSQKKKIVRNKKYQAKREREQNKRLQRRYK